MVLPAIPCSVSNASLISCTAFTPRKNSFLKTRCTLLGKASKQSTLSLGKFISPLSTSIRLFSPYRSTYVSLRGTSRLHVSAVVENNVAVEEPQIGSAAIETPEVEGVSVDSSIRSTGASAASAQSRRPGPGRKSDMPPVKNEELVAGATFTGKVRSIQPFGAFIDFGAFTDGLVHISRLRNGFVKDIASFVSVGQEVKVRLLEANLEAGRISLTMREDDDASKTQKPRDASASSDKGRPGRKNGSPNYSKKEDVKKTKFVKGQDLQGTVKNLTRSGAFISLPEGEEGFLPTSEEANDGFVSVMGGSSLRVGEEVSVRVLRITRGNITLTMKTEEDAKQLNSELTQGVVHVATNPFVLAFRQNKNIASFLDKRDELVDLAKRKEVNNSDDADGKVKENVSGLSHPLRSSEELINASSPVEKQLEVSPESLTSAAQAIEKASDKDSVVSQEDLKNQSGDALSDSKVQIPEDQKPQTSTVQDEIASAIPVDAVEVGISPDGRSSISSSSGHIDLNLNRGSVEFQEDQINVTTTEEVQIQAPLAGADKFSPQPSGVENAGVLPEDTRDFTESSAQTGVPSSKEMLPKAVAAAVVKQLRDYTGAGMMDCKKALLETGGDMVKAQEYLRKKGLASADKKASRATAEGRIGSYIHDNRIGVLIEVNCETDFVSRGDIFKELVDDLAMQVAACPQVQHLVTADVPEDIINNEREIELQKEDLLSKPEQIRTKIVEGRIRKRMEEMALLEQQFVKNDKFLVKDWVKHTIATIGENIKVKRFVRYNLGEGLQKKTQDFAAEVAAQTEAQPVPIKQEEPVAVASDETVQKSPTVAISAALVKQLREETGAGIMDCKKALSETEGDLEKAQAFLRKKGLSSADKKSGRLAAEGRIGSYIHDSRIGVLVEVNCETDFVGRSEKFKELVDDLAMQVVACPQVQFVSIEDIPESTVKKEKELEMQREDLLSKPESIREKIVEGRVSKRLGELVLLEQPFIKDDSLLMKNVVKQAIASLGENIKVRRFVRFTLGESVDDGKTSTESVD